MSQSAVTAIAPLPFELVYSDGEPLETGWHAMQMPLLGELLHLTMVEQGRSDYYVGGDMFVYYSVKQARDIAEGKPYFRGPDVFWVGGVSPTPIRKAWVAWEEGGRLPDVIIELLSPSTARIDRTKKRDLYAQVFQTPEYFMCEPGTWKVEGLRLQGQAYRPMMPDAQGRFWSEQLGVSLGLWHGTRLGLEGTWLRLFRADGSLVPTAEERAAAETKRAEAQKERAEAQTKRAEAQTKRAEAEKERAEAEKERADAEKERADAEAKRAQEERERAEVETKRAEAERKRAEAETKRAETAEAEVARLRALLETLS